MSIERMPLAADLMKRACGLSWFEVCKQLNVPVADLIWGAAKRSLVLYST
jgi:hypothetical protein